MSGFINQYSWKCFLGPRAKIIKQDNGIFVWQVAAGKNQLVKDRVFNNEDAELLISLALEGSCSFYYFTPNDVDFLKSIEKLKVSKHKQADVVIPIDLVNETSWLAGRSNHGIRNAVNNIKNKYPQLEILSNFKKISDVKIFIDKWTDSTADSYFQHRGGKNTYFYLQNYHTNCINTFMYDGDALVAFSTLTPPENGTSVYVIGKCLPKTYRGLTEYLDILSYKKAHQAGARLVSTGGGAKPVLAYKNKFPQSVETLCFDGKIEIK